MKKNLNLNIVLIILFASALTYKFLYKKKASELPKYSNYLSCVGHPYDIRAKLKSEVYLLESLLPESEEERNDLFQAAAYFQNYYTFTNLRDQNVNSVVKWSGMTDRDPKITIISHEKSSYPVNIEFEPEQYNKDLATFWFPDSARKYLNRMSPLGKITKGEPARKVTYEYESDLYLCLTTNDLSLLKNLKTFQPLDPYHAYYVVPISQRKFVKNDIRQGEGNFNPCLNTRDVTSLGFNSFGFYASWLPMAKGTGPDKVPFDCSLFYQEGKSIQAVHVEYSENQEQDYQFVDFGHFEKLKRPIKAAFLFGAQESKVFQKFDSENARRDIELYLSGIDTQEARANLPNFQNKFDPNFSRLLLLLWNISKNMDFIDKKIEADEFSIRITLKGKLRLSKRDLELRFSFSPNHPSFEGGEHFTDATTREFLNNDIVIYEGHSAGGSVFNQAFRKMRSGQEYYQDKSISYQILALYSCGSNFLYRPESFPRIETSPFRRDIIRAAGDYLDHTGNGSLALIASLDGYLYNQSYVPFIYWAKNFKSDNFYILSNHSY